MSDQGKYLITHSKYWFRDRYFVNIKHFLYTHVYFLLYKFLIENLLSDHPKTVQRSMLFLFHLIASDIPEISKSSTYIQTTSGFKGNILCIQKCFRYFYCCCIELFTIAPLNIFISQLIDRNF